MNERHRLRNYAIGLAAAIGLVATTAPAVSAQADVMGGCLAYPPQGGAVIYCGATRSGAIELFEQADVGTVRQLTYLGGTIGSVDVSPNGATIVFEATTPIAPESQVYRIARHGPRAQQVLVGDLMVELGKRVVLVGGEVIEVSGARPHQLTDVGANSNPRFAPDGDRIGFTSDRLGAVQAWSMDLDGSNQRELFLAEVQ